MDDKQTQTEQLTVSTHTLTRSDKVAISVRLGEIALLKGISFTQEQLSTWIREIDEDLKSKEITVDGVKKALKELPREKSYSGLDYHIFYELARYKSNKLNDDVIRTRKMLEERRQKREQV